MAHKTIQDIARQAGVCIGTVSRVLNNKDRVHPETRKRIQGIIDKVGYRPNALGRSLVTRKSHNVMLLLHNIADPHCISIAKHLTRACRKQGYRLLVGDSDYEPDLEAACLRDLGDGSADGLLVSPLAGRRNEQLYRRLADSGFPLVSLMDRVPGVNIPCVKYDDIGGARLATDYLLDKGHRDIVFANWHTEFQTVQDRYRGYVKSHTLRKIPVRPELRLQLPRSLGEIRADLVRVLSFPQSPTAILAENEMVALSCCNVLAQLGRRVPQDMAMMVFGEEMPEGVAPVPMTVVTWRQSELCGRAMELLLAQIRGRNGQFEWAPVTVLPSQLIIRKSA